MKHQHHWSIGILGGMLAATAPAGADTIDLREQAKMDPVSVEQSDDLALALFQDDEEPKDGSWKSRFELSAGGTFGNTDTQTFRTGVNSKRESEADRTFFDVSYLWGATNGDRDRNKGTAGILHDWLRPDSDWFHWADARVDYDEFQSWEYRFGSHAGAGYHWIKEENLDVMLRGGLGFTKEWKSMTEPFIWEGVLGLDLIWRISEKQTFEWHSTLYPSLSHFLDDYRWVNTLGWTMLVDEEVGMSLNAGMRHEYQSSVDAGIEKNDYEVFAGIGFDF